MLKPYGVGNPEPIFTSQAVEVCDRKVFSSGARFRFRQAGRVIGGVAFGIGEDFPAMTGTTVDVAYRVDENEWNETTTVELKVLNARPATQSA
jgi:hypothetical protein